MNKGLTMNKLSFNQIEPISKYLVAAFALLFISACADTRIVTLEESVQQLHNLTDDDSDGVIKAREKCDGTTLGALIDNYGCGSQISKIKPFKIDIKFENNSHVIPVSAYAEINKLAGFLEMYPEIDVVIEGHSSKVGSAKLNKTLSQNRAEAVTFMLINDFEINKSRIASIGYGFERMEISGDTEQAHAANRRIMVDIAHTENIDRLKWTIYTVDQVN